MKIMTILETFILCLLYLSKSSTENKFSTSNAAEVDRKSCIVKTGLKCGSKVKSKALL